MCCLRVNKLKRSYLLGEEEEEQFLLTPPLVLKRATNRRKLNPSGNGLDVEQAIHSPLEVVFDGRAH